MLLYVDETENDKFFIVAGLLVCSKQDIDLAYAHVRKLVKHMPIRARKRTNILTEFKSTLLDKDYQRIKIALLKELNNIDSQIIFACHRKTEHRFSQLHKESTYLTLLSRIVTTINADVDVIFDTFNKATFEDRIITEISALPNVQAISPRDSQREAGLQFIDNVCSAIRLHKTGIDIYRFYEIIKNQSNGV